MLIYLPDFEVCFIEFFINCNFIYFISNISFTEECLIWTNKQLHSNMHKGALNILITAHNNKKIISGLDSYLLHVTLF